MKIYHIISIISVLSFIISIFIRKNNRQFYILYIFYLFPFIDLPITPVEWGGLKVFDVVSFMAIAGLYKELLSTNQTYKVYNWLFIALILLLFLGSLNSLFMRHSMFQIVPMLPIFIFSKLLITELDENPEFIQKILNSIKIVGLISIVFLFIQMYIGLSFTFYFELNRNTTLHGGIRYPSFFHDPQKYGQYLVLISFIFLTNNENSKKFKATEIGGFLLCIVGLLQTGGRTALIALLAGIIILFFTFPLKTKVAIIVMAIAGAFLLVTLFPQMLIFNRIENLNADYLYRAALWDEAKKYFMEHPILGIGLGNYQKYAVALSPNYYVDATNTVIFFDQPESGYWMILAETGILSSIVVILFFLLPIKNALACYFGGIKDRFILLLVASILSWLITFVSVYSLIDKRLFIIVVTYLCTLINLSKIYRQNEIKIIELDSAESVQPI